MAKNKAKKEQPWWVEYLQDSERWEDAVMIPVTALEPDPLNPNEMDDTQLDMLREDIAVWDFDEPIQVVPIPEAQGKFRIVGGEHRWLAAQKAGMEKVPVVVKEGWMDETVRLENLVRRNENRGTRNPAKLRRIILDLRTERRLQLEEEARRFGFSRTDRFKEILEEKESAKQAAAKGSGGEDGEDGNDRSKLVRDNLDYAVRNILSEYGTTAPKGFIFFCYKDQVHLVLQMESGLTECVAQLASECDNSDLEMSDHLEEALRSKDKSPKDIQVTVLNGDES